MKMENSTVDESEVLEISDSDEEPDCDTESLDLIDHERTEKQDEEEEGEQQEDDQDDNTTVGNKANLCGSDSESSFDSDDNSNRMTAMERLRDLEERIGDLEDILDMIGETYLQRRKRRHQLH